MAYIYAMLSHSTCIEQFSHTKSVSILMYKYKHTGNYIETLERLMPILNWIQHFDYLAKHSNYFLKSEQLVRTDHREEPEIVQVHTHGVLSGMTFQNYLFAEDIIYTG